MKRRSLRKTQQNRLPWTITPELLAIPVDTHTEPRSGEQTVNERKERATLGKNMETLGSGSVFQVPWLAVWLGATLVPFLLFSATILPLIFPPLALLVPIGLISFGVGILWSLAGGMRTRLKDRKIYTSYLNEQPPSVQQWAREAIKARQSTEVVQMVRPEREQPLSLPIVPVNQWAKEIWRRCGEVFIGRELVMKAIAQSIGSEFTPYLEPASVTPPPIPFLTRGGGFSSYFYQRRNELVVAHPTYPVRVIDLVVTAYLTRGERPDSTPRPLIQASTYAETWFPADHWLTVFPRTPLAFRKRSARSATAPHGKLAMLYTIRTDNKAWAEQVLTPEVKMMLLEQHPVCLVVDAGRLALVSYQGWLSPDGIGAFIKGVQMAARSAHAAESN